MMKNCPKNIEATRAAKHKREYIAKKTEQEVNQHIVLFGLCHQTDTADKMVIKSSTPDADEE